MKLQYNQHFHAEQIIQCNKNDASISFPNDKMNEVDEQGKTKLQHDKVQKNNKYKMKMRLKHSNESVDERNKRLQLDRVRHMTKRKQSKTVKICNECICNTIKKRRNIC